MEAPETPGGDMPLWETILCWLAILSPFIAVAVFLLLMEGHL